MIEVLLKNEEIIKITDTSALPFQNLDFHGMQLIDYTEKDIKWVEENFEVDLSIIKHHEDFEISSHFSANENQISLHYSVPYYNKNNNLVEAPLFFVFSSTRFFVFSNSEIDTFFNRTYAYKFSQLQKVNDIRQIFQFQIQLISDYFADITEIEAKRIKALANTILLKKEFSDETMDILTRYGFNNLLIKESLIETTRVFNLYKKSSWRHKIDIQQAIEAELNDMTVISDYIQFNFERLDDLKENVSNKIELEQNRIFKILTVATICIALPTLIAGVYGMNFENMPELKTLYGYPVVIVAMLFSMVLPIVYFKKKKWL